VGQNRTEAIMLHPHTIQKFMGYKKDFANLVALYTFYIYHAQLQNTNTPSATNNFVRGGLGWSFDKIKRIKRILKELKLVEVVRKGKYYYIYLPFIQIKKRVKEVIDGYKNTSKENKNTKEQIDREVSKTSDGASQTSISDKMVQKEEDEYITKRRYRQTKQQKEQEEVEKLSRRSPFFKFLIDSNIPVSRAKEIRDAVLSLDNINIYNPKFHSLYLARWLVNCERMGIEYNREDLQRWVDRMSRMFTVEQYDMVDVAIGRFYSDLKFPSELRYSKYKWRSIKIEDTIYKNLQDVIYKDIDSEEFIYKFDNGSIVTYMNVEELFRRYGI